MEHILQPGNLAYIGQQEYKALQQHFQIKMFQFWGEFFFSDQKCFPKWKVFLEEDSSYSLCFGDLVYSFSTGCEMHTP